VQRVEDGRVSAELELGVRLDLVVADLRDETSFAVGQEDRVILVFCR
jgi:hypothetical protein